jgi:outer membrane protein, heavy metal efflux system
MLALALLAGCARFQPRPISPSETAAELEGRSLTNAALKSFLETNLHREIADWPHPLWDFDMLTLAAFYYQPDLAVARAQWASVRAGEITAGERPNPTLSVTPAFNNQIPGAFSPWLVAASLDVPLETAGKRKRRLEQAQFLSQSARLNLATTAWQVRGELRSSLIEVTAAHERTSLLSGQISLQQRIVELLEQQAEAGAIARSELTVSRVALEKLRLDSADARTQLAADRVRLAQAIGVPLDAMDVAELSFDPLRDLASATNLTTAEIRRAALQSRTDILGALADYAAAQSALQLEVAKQYPDLHLGPGYAWNSGSAGDNQWELGLSMTLPVLNQNQGAIAEAAAHREEAAAKFNAVQAKALAEIERAAATFQVSEENLATLQSLASTEAKQRAAVEAQVKAGAMDELDLQSARLEAVTAELVQLDGRVKLQQAAGALEDAVQRPIDTMKTSLIEQRPATRGNQP